MRYVLYLFTSICILCVLGSLTYFLFLIVVTLATILEAYIILPGLLFAIAGQFIFQRTRRLLQQRRLTLATITRLTLDGQGTTTYQLQFTTRKDQVILVELASNDHSLYSRLRTLFLDLYHAQPVYGSRFPLLYNINTPEKDLRRPSFFTMWLGPILLFWFAILFILFGIALWFSS
jgi:hypothetical protein